MMKKKVEVDPVESLEVTQETPVVEEPAVAEEAPAEPIEEKPEKKSSRKKGVVANTAKLNVRVEPSLNAKIVKVISVDEAVEYEKPVDDWCKVYGKSFEGYCMKKYIQ